MSAPAPRPAALLAVLALAACGGEAPRLAVSQAELAAEERVQNDLALDAMLRDHARLLDIAFPLAAHSAALCGADTAPGFGINVANLSSMRKELRGAARERFALGDVPQILHVVPGSPAANAGLRRGDRMLALGKFKVEAGEDSANKVMDRLRKAGADPLVFTVAAGGEKPRRVAVTPVPVCKNEFFIGKSDTVNAYADGDSVVVMAGMMRFAASDEDLALVLAHEMAHNVMRDSQKIPVSAIPGAIVDFVVSDLIGIETRGAFTRGGGRRYTQDFEAEADYVGLYIVARAGFDISGAPDFWRRIAANYPGSIKDSLAALHPPTPYRFVLLKETVAEIELKKSQGAALVPDPGRLDAPPNQDPELSKIAPAAGPAAD